MASSTRLALPIRLAVGRSPWKSAAPGAGPVEHQLLDPQLGLVGQLEAVAGEELDAVVLVGVVAGADHHAGVGAHRLGEEGDARRRQRPGEHHVHAHGADAGGDGLLQHVAGEPGVLADDDAVPVRPGADHVGQGAAELERQLGGHGVDVGDAADAVGAEEAASRRGRRA